MTLSPNDFEAFFAAVNDGHRPFAWQRRLVERLVTGGGWPHQIDAPTGAGKSSVVEVHLFAVALFALGVIPRVPRRLALVVNRRALVDSQAERAAAFRDAMGNAPPGSLLGETDAALRSLRSSATGNRFPAAFDIVDLRGGVPPRRDWVSDPVACQILCATPDMWGSRVLFRGYGTSRLARPREAGLLAHDAAIVLDEAHLNRQLLLTARRVAQLGRTGAAAIGVPELHVVATTATPAGSGPAEPDLDAIGVEQEDLQPGRDEALRQRLTTPKPVALLALDSWPPARAGAERARYVDSLVAETLRMRKRFGPTVGCFVNTVGLATEVTAGLRRAGMDVEMLVGRMRPYDRADLESRRPGLLTVQGNPEVDVVVATQTLEVGVDIDLSALVTELAPASALTQRAGRVNRLGLRERTQVSVAGPTAQSIVLDPDTDTKSMGSFSIPPYLSKGDIASCQHLRNTWEWLVGRAADPDGLGPWTLRSDPPPAGPTSRVLLQRLEPYDMWLLSRTGAELFDEPDLELWLRDSLDPDQLTCGVISRAHLPDDDSAALALLNATPPTDSEIFPASLGDAAALTAAILTAGPGQRRVFLFRGNEIGALAPGERLRGGDVVIVDAHHRVCTEGVVTAFPNEPGSDVYEEAAFRDDGRQILRVLANRSDWEARLLEELADLDIVAPTAQVDGDHDRQITALIHAYRGHEARIGALVADPDRLGEAVSIAYGGLDDPASRWLVATMTPASEVEDTLQQVWTPSSGPVLLDDHNSAVGQRAGDLAERAGLAPVLHQVLAEAGRWHDTGKRDPRFQRFTLNNSAPATLLAKSGTRSIRQLRNPAAGGLPTRWRHEQLSVALAAAAGGGTPHRDLVLRLVGTSHGHGRPGFPHTAVALLGPDTGDQVSNWARKLFDTGQWDELIETTHHQWGLWGCAYLEALLRAADAQISGEGR